MSSTIKIRRNTAAAAASSNPVLAAGELGYETDTGRGKMGDGSTAWNALPYLDRHALAAAIPKSLFDAKGDLIVGTANDTPARLPAGSKGRLLVPDPAEPTGLKWLGGTPGDTLVYSADNGWSVAPTQSLTGTGFPTMDAPIGSTYVDLAATNGAVRWRKVAAGTGFDKWDVEVGDTGWRDIASLLSPGYAVSSNLGIAHIRRIGRVVYSRFKLDVTGSPGNAILNEMPAGFRPGGTSVYQGYEVIAVRDVAGATASQLTQTRVAYLSPAAVGWTFGSAQPPPSPGTIAWSPDPHTTDNAWPTTLPGTPA